MFFNEALRRQMGEQGRISVKEYSWHQSIRNLVNIWQEAIDQPLMTLTPMPMGYLNNK